MTILTLPVSAVYYGTFAHTPAQGDLEILSNTAIGVDDAGIIKFIEIGKRLDDVISEYLIDTEQTSIIDISTSRVSFFFPGFIDTHIHAPQYPNNGIFGNSTLLDWLTTYTFPLESSLKDLSKARRVYEKVVQRTLSNGTTCAAYYATIDADATNLLADIALKLGQRAFIGKVCMNNNSPDYYIESLEESQESTLRVINHIKKIDPQNDLVTPILTPRFAPSCTSDLLKWLGSLKQEHNLHAQTHISENKNEIKWVSKLFPDSKSYADVYNDHDLLDERTILAHAIHLSEHEKDLIKAKGSGISHCPVSNSSITSGECRVRWLLDNEIPVGLGTDVSGGFSPSILQVARHALLVSRHLAMKTEVESHKLSVNDVLYLATMGGAKLVNLEQKIGSFEVGKVWDVQLIDLDSENSQVDVFDWQEPIQDENSKSKWENIIAKWMFNGDDRNTTKVWVKGNPVK